MKNALATAVSDLLEEGISYTICESDFNWLWMERMPIELRNFVLQMTNLRAYLDVSDRTEEDFASQENA